MTIGAATSATAAEAAVGHGVGATELSGRQ
eukprot:COSAG01_NODE_60842_length_292_cov_1.207254_2_plen_29_part_01